MISEREFKLQHRALYHFPLYHAYAAALLMDRGFEVGVIDSAADSLDISSFVAAVESQNPDLIVLEVSTPSFDIDLSTCRALHPKLDVPLALIGSHATVFHRQILEQHAAVDIVIRGEFEETILDLTEHMAKGQAFDDVPGITFRTPAGEIRENAPRPFITDLDVMPYPARELYAWQRYHEPVYEKLPWITMLSSRGCPFSCIFCSWPQTMYGHQYRTRTPASVVAEIEFCQERYKPGEYFFDDDTFTVDKKHVTDICREILERHIPLTWSCMGRIDTVDRETLELMSRAGCRRIKFGLETGSAEVMRMIRKKLDLRQAQQTIRQAQEAGIKVHGTFMIGLPGETHQSVQETIEFALTLNLDSAQFSIATPFPGTEFYRLAEENNWLYTRDWSKYDGATGSVVSYPHLSKKEIDTYLTVAWTRLFSEQRDLLSLLRKTFNKMRDDGIRRTFRVISAYLFAKRMTKGHGQ